MKFFLPYGLRGFRAPLLEADAVSIDDLSVTYPGASTRALDTVSLCVQGGTAVALVGGNGAGKSTLLKALAGLALPQSGRLRVFGRRVGECPQRVAYLPQRNEIDWRFPVSVERFLLTGRYVHLGWFRRPGPGDRRLVRDVADRLGLEELLGRQIGQLSGGQQQRILLGRALVQGADLLLLDEPLNAVDAETRDVIRAMVKELSRKQATVIVATHQQDWVSEDFRVVLHLREGRLVEPTADAAPFPPLGRSRNGLAL
jgi:manganese/zinc/iron transport system ATP- binding protein